MTKELNLTVDDVKTPYGMYILGVILTFLIPIIGLPVLFYTYAKSSIKHKVADIYIDIYQRKTQFLNNGNEFYYIQTQGDSDIPKHINFSQLNREDNNTNEPNKILCPHNSHPYLVTFLFFAGTLTISMLCGSILGFIASLFGVAIIDPQLYGKASDTVLIDLIKSKNTTLNFTNNRKCSIKLIPIKVKVTDTGDYVMEED